MSPITLSVGSSLQSNNPLSIPPATQHILTLLDKYPGIKSVYKTACEKMYEGKYVRNILDDLRLTLELVMKAVLQNEKSLENQRPAVNVYFKDKNKSIQHANLFWQIVEFYCKYQNEQVKHNDGANVNEVRFIIEQTNNCLVELLSS